MPARTQLLCLPLRGGGFLRAEGEMAFRGRGPRGDRQDPRPPPMKMRRARKRKVWRLHYEAPSQHAGCPPHFNWYHQQSGDIRHSALVKPYKSRRNGSGRARWPGQAGGGGNLIVLGFQPRYTASESLRGGRHLLGWECGDRGSQLIYTADGPRKNPVRGLITYLGHSRPPYRPCDLRHVAKSPPPCPVGGGAVRTLPYS